MLELNLKQRINNSYNIARISIVALLLSSVVIAGPFYALPASATLGNSVYTLSGSHVVFFPTKSKTLHSFSLTSHVSKLGAASIGETPGNDGYCFAGAIPCGPVTYHGGAVMHNAKIFLVFWVGSSFSDCSTSHYFEDPTNDPLASSPNDCSYINLQVQFLKDMCSDPFMKIAAQYNDSHGGAGPCFVATPPAGKSNPHVDTTAFPQSTLTDNDIQAAAQRMMTYMGASSDGNTEVFVFIPYNTPSCIDTNQSDGCFGTVYCAYHSNGPSNLIYASIPDAAAAGGSCGDASPSPNSDPVADTVTSPFSHELMESLTDPGSGGWYYQDGAHEVADECAYDYGTINPDGSNIILGIYGNHYLIQTEWSNSNAGCTLSEQSLPAPPSAPPTGIAASPINSTAISVSWTASAGTTNYNVLRSTISSGPFTTLAGTPVTTSFTDNGLSPTTTYYYKLTASNTGGTSTISSPPVSATTLQTNYTITFTENGLPENTTWDVTFDGNPLSSNTNTITTRIVHGNYSWSVSEISCGANCQYSPSFFSGTLSVPSQLGQSFVFAKQTIGNTLAGISSTQWVNDTLHNVVGAKIITGVITSGSLTVTVTNSTSNPVSAGPFFTSIRYVDTRVTNSTGGSISGVTQVNIISNYNTTDLPSNISESSLKMFWWDGTHWQTCSDTGVNIVSKYVFCTITVSTSPNLAYLSGGPFGVGAVSSHAVGGSAPGFAPSFTTGFAQDEYPISINGTGFKLAQYTNTAPSTVQVTTGKLFLLKLLLYGDFGSSFVQHVSLFTNLRDKTREIQQSDTVITWDKSTQPQLSVIDPHGYFGQVTVNSTANGSKLELDYGLSFAKPMATSDIVIRAWTVNLYSSDTYLLDAWSSTPGTLQASSQDLFQESPALVHNFTSATPPANIPSLQPSSQTNSNMTELIKEWGGYSPKSISDAELLHAFVMDGNHIPSWFMKTSKWMVDGTITQQDFENALEYMNSSGMIK